MTEEEEERDNERAEHKSRRITSGPGHDGNVMGDDYEWQVRHLFLSLFAFELSFFRLLS